MRPSRGDDVAVVVEGHERLVDGAVVAPVEHEDLLPVGGLAGEPQREPVRVGRARRDLPEREPEPAGELLADDRRVLGRQHQRDARAAACSAITATVAGGRVPGHRAGVAEAEVDVLVAVDVDDARARRLGREDREPARPAGHPVHRHPAEQRADGAVRELARRGMRRRRTAPPRERAARRGGRGRSSRSIERGSYGWPGNVLPPMAEIRAEITANVWQVVAEEGQMVAEGDEICILESMKMEIPVVTEVPGVVRELHVEPEQVVQEGDLIALIDES